MASSETDRPDSSALRPIASPSPSPALSAYSSTTSTSSFENDYDLNTISLDDWGYPHHRNDEGISPGHIDKRINTTSALSARDYLSGASTPIAKKNPSSLLPRNRTGSEQTESGTNGGIGDTEEDEDEDLEATGFDVEDEDEEDMHAHGVPAARGWRLKASNSNTPAFRLRVLSMFSKQLKLETWSDDTLDSSLLPLSPENLGLKRISGAFSNAVFFVSYKTPPNSKAEGPRTVLLRVYGSGTEVLLSRRTELLILHTLSSLYEIGPHILGTFANGRVETYFDAGPIGKEGMRDLGDRREIVRDDGSILVKGYEGRAQWVARRMRQLHEVPLDTMRAVLEQGDLRTGSENSSGLFGRGIENHLFARSHRPRMAKHRSSNQQQQQQQQQQASSIESRFLTGQNPRDSPAPMTPSDGTAADSSIVASGKDGVQVQAMAIRGEYPTQHRASSVASFDSLATSYNSQDGSISSESTDDLLTSPSLGPSSYFESMAAARKGTFPSPYTFKKASADRRRGSSSSAHRAPYPGVWRRTKRWSREAGKVFAIVDDFCQTDAGKRACQETLKGTALQNVEFTPFSSESLPRIHSKDLGATRNNLKNMLLAIASIDFPRLLKEMDSYKRYARQWEKANGTSKRVLTHGDTQYSNLLLIKDGEDVEVGVGMPRPRDRSRERSLSISGESGGQAKSISRQRSRTKLADFERLIVIDFEYCSPNPRGYDIANAFHEWRFDYDLAAHSWSPYKEQYPNRDEQRRWLRAYVEQGRLLRMRGKTPKFSPYTPSTPLFNDDLTLPPALVSANSDSDSVTAAEAVKANYLDKNDKSANHLETQRKHLTEGQVASSPALLPSASPAMRPAISPVMSHKSSLTTFDPKGMEKEIDRLEKEVQVFSIACHANWALWGITFAREQIEDVLEDVLTRMGDEEEATLLAEEDMAVDFTGACSADSFDNLRYALGRVELFREESAALGIRI